MNILMVRVQDFVVRNGCINLEGLVDSNIQVYVNLRRIKK